ncbi:zinc metalloprotease [Aestuariibaculum suncheonense]|uniref:Membrane metalloprotease n=1 Tax=Aestuariibaculum suncheonense TaxID=1028745 RepID=A0A8J6QA46_9FLAO|nr:membrane metalloprotease [Aestuariibaculum suncheonense]MBD0836467.1 membrane metalloprotease [Aestuariibaculum suncheonense]
MKHKLLLLLTAALVFSSCTKDNSSNSTNFKIENQQATGSSAFDILSDDTYKSLIIELVYVEGFAPTSTAISNFQNFLNARIYKPGGITVEKRAIASPGESPYTTKEIAAIEDKNRTLYNTEDQIAIWMFFADGESDQNDDTSVVLGTAYRNTSFVIYEETLHGFSDSRYEPNRITLESTVINHEFGHILGLTNLGTAMTEDHEDPEHEKHCDVESCLMYWAAESSSSLGNLFNAGTVPQLDPKCLADLQANGGK